MNVLPQAGPVDHRIEGLKRHGVLSTDSRNHRPEGAYRSVFLELREEEEYPGSPATGTLQSTI